MHLLTTTPPADLTRKDQGQEPPTSTESRSLDSENRKIGRNVHPANSPEQTFLTERSVSVEKVQSLNNDTNSKKQRLLRSIDSYNENRLPSSVVNVPYEKDVRERFHDVYSEALSQSSRLFGPVTAPFKMVDDCSEGGITEFDNGIIKKIMRAEYHSNNERSFFISRLSCFLIKDNSKEHIVECYGQYISGADLAYMASHSRPVVADLIFDQFMERIPATALAEIYTSHPDLIKRHVERGRCFQDQNEWFSLLKICRKDRDLAARIFTGDIMLPYFGQLHRAALGCFYENMAQEVCHELTARLTDNMNPDSRCHQEWTEDLIAIWELMLCYEFWADESAALLKYIREQFPQGAVEKILATIMARYSKSSSKNIQDVITHDHVKMIMNNNEALKILLINPPLLFYDNDENYLSHLTSELWGILIEHNPQVSILALGCRAIDIEDLAAKMDACPDKVSSLISVGYDKLSSVNKEDLSLNIHNPSVLALLRMKKKRPFCQKDVPYKEAVHWFIKWYQEEQEPSDIAQKSQVCRLRSTYPWITALRLKLSGKYQTMKITDDDMRYDAALPGLYASELCFNIIACGEICDDNKLRLASLSSQNLFSLMIDPGVYLSRLYELGRSPLFFSCLEHPRHKNNVITALETGYLEHVNDKTLYELCQAHPAFAVHLTEYPNFIKRMSEDQLACLCYKNPAFYKALYNMPNLQCDLGLLPDTLEYPWGEMQRNRRPIQPIASVDAMLTNVFIEQFHQTFPPADERVTPSMFLGWEQGLMTQRYPDRTRGGGVCHGVALDCIRWHLEHPEHPLELYVQKLNRYTNVKQPLKVTGGLPDRVDFLERNYKSYLSDGFCISTSGNNDLDAIKMPCISREGVILVEYLLKQVKFLVICQDRRACALILWESQKNRDDAYISCLDANDGLLSIPITQHTGDWSSDVREWIKELLENSMFKFGAQIEVMAHSVNDEKLKELQVTPVRYKPVDQAF
ncbi:hypothetical protein [Parendozoicomonas sp. Alg238-R29]|uniref:hypothetical protein n=1 Tax=Parendozoicomonas sp. Alg238-R29 TaxID=2993446 RepID=UPI00248ED0DD|nr:hypothetical protein [Parendozoicomonas sp. Alg238-R29]